ncbi:phosphoglucomutase (alpha-D-glucose-1,6-bisphosphate-dependent) [Dyella sp.]|uniref:phosphoglucomutase (alpha-D-glucose-1,6-bisphosphate-dependent) n=1 Tax=Dyella sp. TaxID=1869338 RepID=UPI002B48F802|nr:phosphoglucomutase (alpha-D-glucose-1,6-bisphosphate-dependent) [Dyella sp.]HKT28464.1 phosphoglucomutase (alpha-D-glucose-1,6-bisphosphate-dependent) [Dyella sp.]
MSPNIDALAGKPAPESMLVDVTKLLDAYTALRPDPSEPTQRVSFGTSGHRGSSLDRSFNEWHVLAITQAICDYRRQKNITGPLYIGIDTHALSQPAFQSAVEVLVANDVAVAISAGGEFTPTPAVSHAILTYNRQRVDGLADGIVVTPSHNPPADGGFKYNPPNGGPADTDVTSWIQQRANALLESRLDGVKRIGYPTARRSSLVQEYDYLGHYVDDLKNIIDFDVIRHAGVRMAVDPLGGAGVHYWQPIAQRYGIDLTIVSDTVDPTFRFMTVDWDGKIRMDPSSQYAMQRLIGLKDRYDVAFGCDTDHDRHGVVARSAGLMPSNHYLSVMVDYLFRHRPQWTDKASVGKTVVSSSLIDRVTERLGRRLYEVPVGFKWFADGLFNGVLGFGCEESAGASMLRHDGKVWTTDKDGIVPSLLAAEMTARMGKDPGELYVDLTEALGKPYSSRVDAAANAQQKARLAKLSPEQLQSKELAGEKITDVLDRAPGNNAPIGGIKVMSESGWFAARPSGTEEIYKIYGESFRSEEHLKAILREAQGIVDAALAD